MRIGILTLPLHTNYGGILQAYALQTVLERMGHEVEFIDGVKFKTSGIKLKIKSMLSQVFVPLHLWRLLKMFKAINFAKTYYTKRFVDKHIHVSRFDTIESVNEHEVDAIVVGSDQVWRAQFFGEKRYNEAYLSFSKGWKIRRIAYAASFGSDEWEVDHKMTKRCKELISLFDAVSVREKSAVRMCRDILNVGAKQLLDPTLLLEKDDYDKLIPKHNKRHEPFIMSYIIDTDDVKTQLCNTLSASLQLPVVSANSRVEDTSGAQFSLKEQIQPPVEDWLYRIKHADFIITDSFHACVFSIIYQKQFYVVGNMYRGMARFESLLETLDLKDRLIFDCKAIDCNSRIDYSVVNKLLQSKIRESKQFLINSLNT